MSGTEVGYAARRWQQFEEDKVTWNASVLVYSATCLPNDYAKPAIRLRIDYVVSAICLRIGYAIFLRILCTTYLRIHYSLPGTYLAHCATRDWRKKRLETRPFSVTSLRSANLFFFPEHMLMFHVRGCPDRDFLRASLLSATGTNVYRPMPLLLHAQYYHLDPYAMSFPVLNVESWYQNLGLGPPSGTTKLAYLLGLCYGKSGTELAYAARIQYLLPRRKDREVVDCSTSLQVPTLRLPSYAAKPCPGTDLAYALVLTWCITLHRIMVLSSASATPCPVDSPAPKTTIGVRGKWEEEKGGEGGAETAAGAAKREAGAGKGGGEKGEEEEGGEEEGEERAVRLLFWNSEEGQGYYLPSFDLSSHAFDLPSYAFAMRCPVGDDGATTVGGHLSHPGPLPYETPLPPYARYALPVVLTWRNFTICLRAARY
eukprot:3941582-Rhodomonas_salina.1